MNHSMGLNDKAVAAVSRAQDAPVSEFRPKGKFQIEHRNNLGELLGVYDIDNAIVDVGLNHILGVEFGAITQVATWYIGLIDNASFTALANGDTMSSHSGWIENAGYSNSNRPTWTAGTASARSITNGSTVDFTINATNTIKGIFITSDNTKSGTSGTLWSTASFGSTVSVTSGDTLKVTYTVSG